MKNKMIVYPILYIALVAITVFGFFELWPSLLRPDSFLYVVFFICYLESLIFLFPLLTQSGVIDKTKGQTSFLVILANFITIYIIVSLFLLLIGLFLESSFPNLIYILNL